MLQQPRCPILLKLCHSRAIYEHNTAFLKAFPHSGCNNSVFSLCACGGALKYGGSGMLDLLKQLFTVIWREEFVPPQWREGLIVNLFKKGEKEDPGNYRGITLLGRSL